MTVSNHLTLEDVLIAIVGDDGEPSHENLVCWTRRYPKFSGQLTDFFATWAEQEEAEPGECRVATERVASLAVSHALNLLHAREMQNVNATEPQLRRLSQVARQRGLSDADLAGRCGFDEGIIVKLDRHRIVPITDIPMVGIQRLMAALSESFDRVLDLISGPPIAMSAGSLRKARGPAVLNTETFSQAIQASKLPDDKKQDWLRLPGYSSHPP